ncbi:MAG TPA: hypothetical protein ENJ60_03765 [Aeromonadales bacterium]|nr:hypothetical protein [Aeromonadales bacterium]
MQQFDELLQKYSEYANYKSLENKIKYSSIFNQVSLPDTEFILNRLECAEMTCIASLEYHHRNDIIEAVKRLHAMKEFDSKAMISIGSTKEDIQVYHRAGLIFTVGGFKAGIIAAN